MYKQPTEEEYDLALLEAKRNVYCDATESAEIYEFKAPIKKTKTVIPYRCRTTGNRTPEKEIQD